MSFLDEIDGKAKMNKADYKAPAEVYKFNDPKFEVALGESDLENEGEV